MKTLGLVVLFCSQKKNLCFYFENIIYKWIKQINQQESGFIFRQCFSES